MKVTLYRRVNENKKFDTITLDDWLHKVTPRAKNVIETLRELNKTDVKEAKTYKTTHLPCTTISGVFDGERKTSQVTETNPIICVDIDEKPEGMTWGELKKMVFDLPYVFYVSLSARGEGVFAMVHYNNKRPISDIFKCLEQDFGYMGITIDKACKDITRLRFVSYDDEPLEKEGEVSMYDGVFLPDFEGFRPQEKRPEKTTSFGGDIDDRFMYKTIDYLIRYCGYRSDSYNDWLLDGFRLATLGQYGHNLFMYLSQMSEGYRESEAERKWRECLGHTEMSKDCLLHYYREAKERIGNDWRTVIRRS